MDIEKNVKLTKEINPDIALDSSPAYATELDWVGMTELATPILYVSQPGDAKLLPAVVEVGVSLDRASSRGIHMSRLFSILQKSLSEVPLSFLTLQSMAKELLSSQAGLSESVQLKIKFTLPIERSSLLSGEKGWRQYPVWLSINQTSAASEMILGTEVLYSSTCPCSGALAKQLLLNQFDLDFVSKTEVSVADFREWLKLNGLKATPHAQRSRAKVEVTLSLEGAAVTPLNLIDQIEKSLGTPVQALVKRVDEQEFARLNGSNMMFCEDAARKLKSTFDSDLRYLDFSIEVEHQESLHAHNAVARVRK